MKKKPASVHKAKQAGETDARWHFVERRIWTDRMLEALVNGVKGGVWFSLIDKVYRRKTLDAAWKRVQANKGSAGVDHETIAKFSQEADRKLDYLSEQLRTGEYQPRPVRRVWIEKTGSHEKRPLGIPTVSDRIVQTAILMVIEPIFENAFHESSFGYRPGRGCKDALREVNTLLKDEYVYVVDADLEKYFDSIPHDKLMEEVKLFIADNKLLALIEKLLKQSIEEDGKELKVGKGTPQGGVLSPLLANLYLHSIDLEMSRQGYRMVRYADDLLVLTKSKEEAEKALEVLQNLVGSKGLRLNLEKTRLVDTRENKVGFDFLGYHFENG